MKINNPKKHIIILIIFLILFSAVKQSYAQTWVQMQNQIEKNTKHIEIIDGKISDLKDNYHLLYDGAKNQNDQLSNQISFAGYLLGVLSLFFTFLGFILAWYINRQSERIKEMKDIVETTKKAIDGHSTDLYKKLKREETLSLLMRLEEVPEDITNVCTLLLSRDLLENDYLYLKAPYLKIKNDLPLDVDATGRYLILLMQHFPYQSLKDLELKEDIITNTNPLNLHAMFSRDIKNFFDQVLKYLNEFGLTDEKNKSLIKKLFYFYSKSRFKTNMELQNYIRETLIKYGVKTSVVSSIVKEYAPADTVYTIWVDSIFN